MGKAAHQEEKENSISKSMKMATGNHLALFFHRHDTDLGYWHQRADERHGNLPQGKQELLVVRDKVGRSQVNLG